MPKHSAQYFKTAAATPSEPDQHSNFSEALPSPMSEPVVQMTRRQRRLAREQEQQGLEAQKSSSTNSKPCENHRIGAVEAESVQVLPPQILRTTKSSQPTIESAPQVIQTVQKPSAELIDQNSLHTSTVTEIPQKKSANSFDQAETSTDESLISQYLTSTALLAPERFLTPATHTDPLERSEENAYFDGPKTKHRISKRKLIGVSTSLAASSMLLFALALPGVQIISPEQEGGSIAGQQHMHTGNDSDMTTSFDALNVVNVEAGDTPGSFTNYTDALIQYPFASTVGLTDPFGERSWPVSGFHDAQDFGAPAGTPVQAMADGIVIEAGYASDGCGFGLKLSHVIDGQDITSRYCHMQVDSHDLKIGDVVTVGSPVGRVGNTGLSFGPHLHFVITIDGEAIDPMPFLLHHNRESRK